MDRNEFWNDIPDDAPDIEGLIWRNKQGRWVMLVTDPASGNVRTVRVYHNPWTGEPLPETDNAD